MTYYVVGAGVVWFVVAIMAGDMAANRKRDGAIWMLLGFIFGPLALLALAINGKPPES